MTLRVQFIVPGLAAVAGFALLPSPRVGTAAERSDFAVPELASRTEGWPTYMHDATQSGVSFEPIGLPLHEQWVYRAPAAPKQPEVAAGER